MSLVKEMSWTRGPDLERELVWPQGTVRGRGGAGAHTSERRGLALTSDRASLAQGPSEGQSVGHTTLLPPQFDSNSTVEVFAPRGGTASIECHVFNLGDRAVSQH